MPNWSGNGSGEDDYDEGSSSVIWVPAYCLSVTVACLILCIICIIQTVVQVCLCRKLRKERSVIFKHNSGKGEGEYLEFGSPILATRNSNYSCY